MACPPDWPGIPGFEEGLGVVFCPVDGERAAVEQDDDHRLAGFGDSFEHLLLDVGEVDVRAVAAGEALGVHLHLFAFEARGEADEGYDYVGFLAASTASSWRSSWRGIHSKARPAPLMRPAWMYSMRSVVRAGVGEGDGEVLNGSVVAAGGRELGGSRGGRARGFQLLAVEVEGEFQLVLAGVAEGEAELEVEGFGTGGGDYAYPANGKGLGGGVARFDGVGEGPVEVDFLVDAGHCGSALEAGSGEVFASQSLSGRVFRYPEHRARERGARHP